MLANFHVLTSRIAQRNQECCNSFLFQSAVLQINSNQNFMPTRGDMVDTLDHDDLDTSSSLFVVSTNYEPHTTSLINLMGVPTFK
jgi:hypothetical protein